ncbi:MAG: hypothetical protein RMJ60_08470, partial [Anaerolineales bacterium]|nr:hypothetical protein [Anaerolineales bacterium]
MNISLPGRRHSSSKWPPSSELVLVLAQRNGELADCTSLFASEIGKVDQALLLLGSIEISDYLDLIVRPADLAEFVNGLLKVLLA